MREAAFRGKVEPVQDRRSLARVGNPLEDIRRVRDARLVIKAGRVYDPAALIKSAEGKIGPASAAESAAWGARGG
jgi:hypothetical protein